MSSSKKSKIKSPKKSFSQSSLSRSPLNFGFNFPPDSFPRSTDTDRYPKGRYPKTNVNKDYIWKNDLKNHPKIFYQFIDPKTQYLCTIRRNELRAYLAYVKIEDNHPFYIDEEYEFDSHGDLFTTEFGVGVDYMHCEDFIPGLRGRIIMILNINIIGLMKKLYWTFQI